ncbi:GNAT family N-acetyltransferase [Cytophagaceae bacterium DM2B3-1]|uniref:GNAT family N-acetyltransferase n=1 Tax=Xanthocytophaga flava TaxID=3048013 RepID=A0ABT7CTM8_9BACT|nr:GNAT family N-acetyltransferase [Xanthocytophaga flavus]MDJ1497133.1 GNAT family N-acetyltransferase [Xanthocytophaga flavus]
MTLNYTQTRLLEKGEQIPYELLLLADETIEIIDSYAKGGEICIFEHNSQIIGVYILYILDTETIEIKNIEVHKDYQGLGIGTHLLNEAIQRAKEKGFKTLVIGTANGAIKQLYLYQKVGFEITGIRKNFFIDNYPAPIYENGILCKHMIMLEKQL